MKTHIVGDRFKLYVGSRELLKALASALPWTTESPILLRSSCFKLSISPQLRLVGQVSSLAGRSFRLQATLQLSGRSVRPTPAHLKTHSGEKPLRQLFQLQVTTFYHDNSHYQVSSYVTEDCPERVKLTRSGAEKVRWSVKRNSAYAPSGTTPT